MTGGALVFLGAALYVPTLRSLFRFSLLHPDDVAICIVVAAAGTAWFEVLKLARRRRRTA